MLSPTLNYREYGRFNILKFQSFSAVSLFFLFYHLYLPSLFWDRGLGNKLGYGTELEEVLLGAQFFFFFKLFDFSDLKNCFSFSLAFLFLFCREPVENR